MTDFPDNLKRALAKTNNYADKLLLAGFALNDALRERDEAVRLLGQLLEKRIVVDGVSDPDDYELIEQARKLVSKYEGAE